MTIEDVFERELSVLLRELNSNQDLILQAFSASDIEENRKNGIISAVFTIEGPAGFGYDPALLENLYQIGFRISTLGWNEKNILTGSHLTGGGLTEQGREYVKEAQRLGMIIDVSHISGEGFRDIMDMTQAPVIASHSNSRAVCDSSRNLTDDMFRQICATGGVAGLNLWTDFVGGHRDLDAACGHILHFMEMDPDAKHIALGGDLDGCTPLVQGFGGIQDYPKLAEALLKHGLDEKCVSNIFWNNAFELMKRCCV
jgi:membrane dipeptidase